MAHNDYPGQGERDEIAARNRAAALAAGLARKEVAKGRPFSMGPGSVEALAAEVRGGQDQNVLTPGKKLVVGRGPGVHDFALTRSTENWGSDASSAVTKAIHAVALEPGRDVATAVVSETDASGTRKFALVELPFGSQNPEYTARTGKQVSGTGVAEAPAHETERGESILVEGNGLRVVGDKAILTLEAVPDAHGNVPEIVTLTGGFDPNQNPGAVDLQALLSTENLFTVMGRASHEPFTAGRI